MWVTDEGQQLASNGVREAATGGTLLPSNEENELI